VVISSAMSLAVAVAVAVAAGLVRYTHRKAGLDLLR